MLLLALGCSADPTPVATPATSTPTETGLVDTDPPTVDTDGGDTDMPPPPTPCFDDAFEDNDDLDAALPLESGELWSLAGDPDYWSFQVDPGDAYRVELTFEQQDGNLDLAVYDALYILIGTSYSFSDNESIEVRNDSVSTVTARARVELNGTGCNRYTLELVPL